ncbi:disease resistance TIR-NBS-LRR class family protein, partial [Tanacetum coccineum]
VLKKLKFLALSESSLTTFDFRITPNLETLSLNDFFNLEELCMTASCQNLNYLHIGHSKLRTFDLGLTPNLKTFSLFNSTHFVKLHVSVVCPNLKIINLRKSRLRSLDLELIPNLERLDLQYSNELVEIKAPIGCLKKVVYLNLSGCQRFPQFVFGGGCEPKVNCSSATLQFVGEFLDLIYDHCTPTVISQICGFVVIMMNIYCYICSIIACTDLKKISDIISSLQKLTPKCNILDSICILKHLKSLTDDGDLLQKLPEDLGRLKYLERLHVRSKKIEYLPECCHLGKFPEDIGQLESLERLALWATTIKHLPDSICMLKHLKYLNLSLCALLETLPEDIGLLKCLKELDITHTGISHL